VIEPGQRIVWSDRRESVLEVVMGIFSRISDIVNSNINALLDKAEDPEKMVRLIIQEMEEALVEVRSTSARAIADRKEVERRQGHFAAEAAEWERKAEVAVAKNRDDLARAALAERNRAEEAGVLLQRDLALLEDTLQKLAADITALQAKIKDAKARQSALILRNQAGQARLGARRQLADHTIDDALRRFEDYERKMDDLEGQIESYDLSRRTLADEIADLETSERLDAELSALKTRMAGQVAGTVRTSDKEP
jgi:phage shock protein A